MPGFTRIDGFFKTWIKKDSVIGEELSQTFDNYYPFKNLDEVDLVGFSLPVYAYDGEGDTDWLWDESNNLLPNIRLVCTLKADLSGLQKFLKVQKTSAGQDFLGMSFKVKVLFGGTALKARLMWKEGVSILHFHPQVTDIWLCLSENSARRPCQRYSELSLLDCVWFPS